MGRVAPRASCGHVGPDGGQVGGWGSGLQLHQCYLPACLSLTDSSRAWPSAFCLQIEEGPAARQGLVDSLNVSVATGVLLHRLLTAQEPGSGSDSSVAAADGEVPAAPAVAVVAEEL